jgi:hypothetical protein
VDAENRSIPGALEATHENLKKILDELTRDCTGMRLGGALYLTAAHCLSTNSRPAGMMPTVSFSDAWVKHVNKLDDTDGDGDVDNDDDGNVYGELYTTVSSRCKNLKPKQQCAVLQLDGLMHPNFAGTGDYLNDVAVVHVRTNSQTGLRTVMEAAKEFATDVAFISTASPQVGDPVETAGWGPDGNNDKGFSADQYALRTAATRPADAVGPTPNFVNGMYEGSYIRTIAALNSQLCRGDSGGPSYDQFRHVIGVSSHVGPFDTVHTSCSKIGATQYMSRALRPARDVEPVKKAKKHTPVRVRSSRPRATRPAWTEKPLAPTSGATSAAATRPSGRPESRSRAGFRPRGGGPVANERRINPGKCAGRAERGRSSATPTIGSTHIQTGLSRC